MICPHCGFDNLPGSEECGHCLMDLTQLDRPMAQNRVERSLMEQTVAFLRSRAPVTVQPDQTVGAAIELLLEHDVGALVVVDEGGMLIGIFSERDLLLKVAGIHEDYSSLPIRQFMTPNPETVTATDTLAFVLHKMDVGGYRHLPVVQDHVPVSVISVRDMLRHLLRQL